jgi:hypothetical protein
MDERATKSGLNPFPWTNSAGMRANHGVGAGGGKLARQRFQAWLNFSFILNAAVQENNDDLVQC